MASAHYNIVRLNCELIPHAACILVSLFCSEWKKLMGRAWKNTPEDGKDFISSCGKNIWISATRRQKELLQSGNILIWDLKLLNHVLQRLELKENEKNQIRLLYDVCNNISRGNETLTNDILVRIEEMVENLDSFGSDDSEEEFDLENDYAKTLNDLFADDFRKAAIAYCEKKDYSSAINAYTEAIKLNNLSMDVLEELYFSRSEMYLMQTTKEDNDSFSFVFKTKNNTILSLEDAKRAVLLAPGHPEAQFQLACAYFASNKFSKSLKRLNIAGELGKLPPKAAEMRKECEKKMESEETATCYAEKGPKSNAELAAELSKRSGMKMTAEALLKMEKTLKDAKDPTATVWQAHKYMAGCDCEKNCKLGIELYEEAAEQGNVEAMFNLGVIYREGKHVEKDLKKSLMYLNKAAESNIVAETGYREISVGEAQFELGFMRQKGIGLSRDYEEAVKYFTKSSGNGNKDAARTLGQFYFNGNCVEKDVEKAIQFWNLAAKRCDGIAMQILAEYYLDYDVDPEQALKWHFRAIEAGNLIAKEKSGQFKSKTKKIKREIGSVDDEMIRWEKKNGFFGLDDAMDKRRRRYMEFKFPGVTNFGEYMSKLRVRECLPMEMTKGVKESDLTLELIEEFIEKGGIYARDIKKAFLHFQTGKNYLTFLDGNCWRIIVHELAEAFRITEKIMLWNHLIHFQASELVSWAMELKTNTEQIDRDLRVCFVTLNQNSLELVMSVLEESMKLYPNDIWFLQTLCSLLGFGHGHQRGAQMAEEGLAREPNNIHLLYLRSAHLRMISNRDRGKVIKAQEKFLAAAPPDHYKVPDVYFALAVEHTKASKNKNSLDLVAKYYYLGLQAEKKQIPFFLRKNSDVKAILEQMMALKPFRMAFQRQQTIAGGMKMDVGQEKKPEEEKKKPKKEENKLKKEEEKEINDGIDAERLKILTNPRREVIIRDHRDVINRVKVQLNAGKCSTGTRTATINCTIKPKLKQKAPPQLAEVKSITLREMDPFKEQVYNGFEFKCVIIDEPSLRFTGVGIIVEDENGDVERVSVYNIEKDEEVHNKIGFGCKITILNPYFKIAMDQKQIIRVDDLESVIFDEGPDLSRCRYCGKTGAVKKCGRCLRACYCSKECQERDWKILRHKFVCKKI